MTSANIISAFLGAFLSITIVFLTRRDHLSPMVAARWFVVAVLVLTVSFFPGLVDKVGASLGIAYPPIIALIVALGAALIKILLMDIERQRLKTTVDRLVQRMAILESSVENGTVVKAGFDKKSKVN